jgi:hypothetical protein
MKSKTSKILNTDYILSVMAGILLFFTSLVVNYTANLYVKDAPATPVNDVILSNLPFFEVDEVIIVLSILMIVMVIYECSVYPRRIPFTLEAVGLFILIRALFISMTHIGPFTPRVVFEHSWTWLLGLGGIADLFFSGHTGLPFLAALIFWDHPFIRSVYLAGSIALGASVLLGHLHYSIDVFSAFFITYAIFHIAQRLFADDWHRFHIEEKNRGRFRSRLEESLNHR